NRFGSTTGTLTILGQTATISQWSDSMVTTTIPISIDDSLNTGNIVLTRNSDSKTDTFTNFRVLPKIQNLNPSAGSVGTDVTISGDHFCQAGTCPPADQRNTATTTVTFNGINVSSTDVTTWTATTVVAKVPTSASTGPVIVKSNSYDSNGVTFNVAIPPNATSFTNDDDSSLTDGGRPSHQITVNGTDFGTACSASTTIVKIGTYEVPCANVSEWTSTTIKFTIPTGSGLPNGGLSTNGLIVRRDDIDDGTPLTFYVYPRIISAPSSARQGESITITGDAFGATQETSTVTINGTNGTITSYSETSIDVTVEGGTISGTILFTRSADGKTSNTSTFTILPRITAPTPISAPASTSITISGDHFDSTTGTVSINGAGATVSSWSDTSIEAIVPSAAAPTGTIIVTRTDSQTSNGYSFTVRPTISSLSVSQGRVGDSVTISGDHFGDPGAGNYSTAVNNVKINGSQVPDADVTSWSDTSITAKVPLSGSATGSVVVTANSTSSNGLNFTILPRITSPTPTSSRATDPITISGDHFGSNTGIISVNDATASISSWSDTSINITVPLAGATSGSIIATSSDSRVSNAWSFTILPRITSLNPTSGTFGDTVTISGDHFGTDPGAGNRSTASDNVKFDATQVPEADFVSWSDSQIVVKVPSGVTTGLVVVRRNNNDSNGVNFTVSIADATSFTNNSEIGLTDGGRIGQSITVLGSNFGNGPCDGTDYAVKIGTSTVACSDISWASTTITFIVSSTINVYGGTGADGLIIRAGGNDDSTPLDFYVYPKIDSLTVPSGFPANSAREYQVGDSDGVITLNGSRFGTTGTVTVLGQTSTITSYTDTSVELQIPASIADDSYIGDIVLSRSNPSDNKIATSTNFRILPRITSLSPNNGMESDPVTVNGNHFCQTGSCPGVGDRNTTTTNVTFNGTNVLDADVTSWSDTSINVKVPTGATTGPVIVKSNNYTSKGVTFSVGTPVPDASTFSNNTEVGLTDGGRPGQSITVTGTNFGSSCSAPSTVIKIGSYVLPCSAISSWSSTSTTFFIPTSTTAYGGTASTSNGLIVRANDQDDLTPLDFYVYPDVITISAPSAREGETITLSGRRFGSAGTITVLGENASVSWSDTSISVTIPSSIADDSYTGAIILTRTSPSGNKSDTATTSFRILPHTVSLNPASGQVGTQVTISGDHFCQEGTCPSAGERNTATTTVTFNGINVLDADITTWTATTVVAKVPAGASTGPVIVKSNSYDSNGVVFTVGVAAPPEVRSLPPPPPPPEEIVKVEILERVRLIQEQIEELTLELNRLRVELEMKLEAEAPKPEIPEIPEITPPLVPAPTPTPPIEIIPPEAVLPPTPTPVVVPERPILQPLINAVKGTVEKIKNFAKTTGETIQTGAKKIDNFIRNTAQKTEQFVKKQITKIDLTIRSALKKTSVQISRFVLKIWPKTGQKIAEKIALPPDIFILRSGNLELVAKKEGPIQTIVGYQFTAEIMPSKPTKDISDTFVFDDSDNDGIWTAEIEMPQFTGEFDLTANINYQDGSEKKIRSPVLIDPGGYLFEQMPRGELRIADAKVTLWQREKGEWVVWPAEKYNQTNPQITGRTGEYSFLAPAGEYYLEITAQNYETYRSVPFVLDVVSPVNEVIELNYLGE
ncbi:hypothetical protein AMJ49_03515, partial [Parcubacteria bacterium DG_74_2]